MEQEVKRLREGTSERGSGKKEGMDRPADSGMWTQRPLLSPRLPKKPPTTCSRRESIICTVSHTHRHHRHTTTILCVLPKSVNILTVTCTRAHIHTHTQSFIILLLAAISIRCAFNAPTSTALPVGQTYPSPPQGPSLSLYPIPHHFDAHSPHLFLIYLFPHLACSVCKSCIVKEKRRRTEICLSSLGSYSFASLSTGKVGIAWHAIRDAPVCVCVCGHMLTPLIQSSNDPFCRALA